MRSSVSYIALSVRYGKWLTTVRNRTLTGTTTDTLPELRKLRRRQKSFSVSFLCVLRARARDYSGSFEISTLRWLFFCCSAQNRQSDGALWDGSRTNQTRAASRFAERAA